MFVARWIGWLLSLPFVWLGQGTAMLNLPLCVPLLEIAWLLRCECTIGLAALARIGQYVSPEAARRRAAEWLTRHPQPETAAYAGVLAMQAGEPALARELLARAQQLGGDRSGMVEMLELAVADAEESSEAVTQTCRRLAQRDDLSPSVSKLVHQQLLCDAMVHGRLDEVQRRGEHLWSIEDDPLAATALWAVARRRGEGESLEARLRRFELAPPARLQLEVLGHLAAGKPDEVRKMLAQLRETDPRAADQVEQCLRTMEPRT